MVYKAKVFTSNVHYGFVNKANWLSTNTSLVSIFRLKNIMILDNG